MKSRDPEHRRKLLRQWRQANPEKTRLLNLKSNRKYRVYKRTWKYGITIEQYETLLMQQSYKCASCGVPFGTLPPSEIHLDHCHMTKKVRGILCGPCNRTLGLMKDDPAKLIKLAKYIARFV